MAKTEFSIGEVFRYGLIKLICVPAKKKGYCEGCFFENRHCNSDINGFCDPNNREDKEHVIFLKLEE